MQQSTHTYRSSPRKPRQITDILTSEQMFDLCASFTLQRSDTTKDQAARERAILMRALNPKAQNDGGH